MQVRVRLFAALRERAGASELELELPEGAVVADALRRMSDLTAGVPVVMAVNQEYADDRVELHGGDEVALIPPVSGGSEIAALHVRAARPEDTDWAQIDRLYATLERLQPSPVVTLNRAVAVSKVRGAEAALEMIEPLGERLSNYFHFFGVRGAFLMQLGRNDEARVAFDRAIALANTSAEAAHIRMHLDRLMRDSAPRGAKAK